jgi:hypothetical protein
MPDWYYAQGKRQSVVEGDFVMVRYTERETQVAPIFGVEPGKSYEKLGSLSTGLKTA